MKPRPRDALLLLLLMPGAPALAQSDACLTFPNGASEHTYTCGPGPHRFNVWGSGPYTGDSHICTAAVHAGAVGPEGGQVTAIGVTPPAEWQGTTANGVSTLALNKPWGTAFVFVKVDPAKPLPDCGPLGEDAPLNCHCDQFLPPGPVWGSGPYAADSDICTAARHAGVTTASGGEVTLRPAPGQESYAGSLANGIRTLEHGRGEASFDFVPNK